jgi:large subunit ribosomal protein L17
MRKQVFGRQFKRDINQRKALFRSLMRELVLHERIRTTEAKAKSIKGEIEKHITKAKVQGEASRVHLQRDFHHDVVEKIVTDLAPRFKDRPGGYTRIIRVGNRVKDNAPMVFIELVEKGIVVADTKPVKRSVAKQAAGKKIETKEAKVPVAEAKEEKVSKKLEKKETKAKKGTAKK